MSNLSYRATSGSLNRVVPAPALVLSSRHLLPLPTANLATGGSHPPPQSDENRIETGAGHGMIHEPTPATTAFP
jgi:hypothetical protein